MTHSKLSEFICILTAYYVSVSVSDKPVHLSREVCFIQVLGVKRMTYGVNVCIVTFFKASEISVLVLSVFELVLYCAAVTFLR